MRVLPILISLAASIVLPQHVSEALISSLDDKEYTITIPVLLSGLYNKSLPTAEALIQRNCIRQAVEYTLNTTTLPGYKLDWRVIDDVRPQNALLELANLAFETKANSRAVLSPIVAGPAVLACEDTFRTMFALRKMMTYFNVAHFLRICYFPFQFLANESVGGILTDVTGLRASLYQTFGQKWFNWKEIGVVATTYANWRDVAIFVASMSLQGTQIVHFDVADSYMQLFEGLVQQGRSRIVLVWTYRGFTQRTSLKECAEIYCSSYKAGVRAPNYLLFITTTECGWQILPGENMAKYCSMKIIREQVKIAFFVGQMTMNENIDNDTSISYNTSDAALLPNVFQSFQRAFDWDRQMQFLQKKGCSGFLGLNSLNQLNYPILATILALNKTEQRLVDRKGKSIKALATDRKLFVENLFTAVKELDLFLPTKVDIELMMIWYVRQGTALGDGSISFRDVGKWAPATKSDVWVNYRNTTGNFTLILSFEKSADPIWATKTGRQPKDLSEVVQMMPSAINSTAFGLLYAFAASVFILQLLMLVISSSSKLRKIYFDVQSNAIPLVGCMILDISAFLGTTGGTYFFEELCYLIPLLPVLGLSIVNGWLLLQTATIHVLMHQNRYISSKARKPNLFSLAVHEETRKRNLKVRAKKIQKQVSAIVGSTLLILIVWLSSDPIGRHLKIEGPLFDVELDSYYYLHLEWCSSPGLIYWIGFLLVLHDTFLVGGCARFASLPQKFKFVRAGYKAEIRNIKMTHYNSLMLVNFTFVLMAVLSLKSNLMAWQNVAFNAAQLAFSLSTSLIIFHPFSRLRCFAVVSIRLNEQTSNIC